MDFDLSTTSLPPKEVKQLLILLGKNFDLFSTDWKSLGKCDIECGPIITSGPPIRSNPYKTNPNTRAEIRKQVTALQEAGLIVPSSSPYWSPVVMVGKPDGSYRFAVDYRKLNQVTSSLYFPLIGIDTILQILGEAKAKYFSSIDLLAGFWQLRLDPDTAHKTTFITEQGPFHWVVLPFGLKNAPAEFSSMIYKVFSGLNFANVICYVDDILTFSQTFQDHLTHLQQVFDRLRKHNLKVKPSKCKFACTTVPYLGYNISPNGLSIQDTKLHALKTFPRPTNTKSVRSWLGLTIFFRRFVKDYAKIAYPLTQLLKKNLKFKWTEECEKAFLTLKSHLNSEPIFLAFLRFDLPVILTCDASDYAIGYILCQITENKTERAIAFAGQNLNASEKNRSGRKN